MGKKVLVVDDDSMNRKMAEMILKKGGYEVECVASGQACLDSLSQEKPDLVLLDIEMPEMNGIVTLKKIREQQTLDDVLVMFLTAETNEAEIENACEGGACGYIQKPFKPPVFQSKVSQVLGE